MGQQLIVMRVLRVAAPKMRQTNASSPGNSGHVDCSQGVGGLPCAVGQLLPAVLCCYCVLFALLLLMSGL